MACQQCAELVTCCGIFLFVLMSHRLLAQVGMMAGHDSLCGDQATVCFVCDKDVFIMLCSCLFSVTGPLSVGIIV